MTIESKFIKLKTILKDMGSAVIAYSGGVDSTFLNLDYSYVTLDLQDYRTGGLNK